jgi:hypothetical protein
MVKPSQQGLDLALADDPRAGIGTIDAMDADAAEQLAEGVQRNIVERIAPRHDPVGRSHRFEHFLGADMDDRSMGVKHRPLAAVDDPRADAVAGQFGRGRQPDRPGADDRNLDPFGVVHRFPSPVCGLFKR